MDAADQETIKRIEHYIGSPPENSRVFTFTPAVCEYLLAKFNSGNRPKKPAQIAIYSKHMAGGSWWLTGDTVKFSDAMILRDGQNRMMACVRSGRPFRSHVVFGIDDAAFVALDQGKNRDGSDILSIAGYTNTRILSAAVRWVYLLDVGRVKNRDTIEPDHALRLIRERYPKLPDFISQARTIYTVSTQPAGIVAALIYMFHRHNPDKAAAFANAWATGDHGGRFAVLAKLQKHMSGLTASSSGRVHEVVRMAHIMTAWHIFLSGRRGSLADFKWNPADDFPKIGG